MKKQSFRKGWYVIYTKSNYEKRVYQDLKLNFEVFLPTRKIVKQWSDRKKILQKPLYKSYVFVYLNNSKEQERALYVNGACCYICVQGLPALVTDREIEIIKIFIGDFSNIELTQDKIKIGEKRRINYGPFSGYDCYIANIKGKDKIIARIDSLNNSIIAEFDKAHLVNL